MRAFDIIKKKRDGETLTSGEIDFFVRGASKGEIPDYQITALLMAIYFNGMTGDETYYLTSSMMNSGEVLNLSDIPGIKVDKHSTGGVGDKLTLTIAPLAASAGIKVPMISGRGLGHTGGTIDKLESIPGFKTNLSAGEFIENIRKIGISIISQTEKIAPADRKFYALRDVTATVEAIPLIAGSIMSKKLAEGIDGLVLDVKTGNGSFMKSMEKSRELAEALVAIAMKMGKKAAALITDMSQPTGYAVGNSLEVIEAMEILKGRGPDDVKELTLNIGSYMLKLGGIVTEIEEGTAVLEKKIQNGAGLKKLRDLIESQGGNTGVIEDYSLFPKAEIIREIKSNSSGYVQGIDTEKIGTAACILGAGRLKADSAVDHSAGLILNKKIGDRVEKGETLIAIYTNKSETIADAESLIDDSFIIGGAGCIKPKLIYSVLN